jgi:hypothetical protein
MKSLIAAVLLFSPLPVSAGLVISEIAPCTAGDDWVEIFYDANDGSSVDISSLYVTMYYGTNEPLSKDPVTLYSYDRPETPYDDRYAVVHLTSPGMSDETDFTGDTDRNGRIDVYCNNYSGSLWNAECVVALDTDDDPSNGMIDFAAWSDNDGSPSDTIMGYVEASVSKGQWMAQSPVLQSMLIAVPRGGIPSYQSIARRAGDTNGPGDFEITQYQTPGRANILGGVESSSKLFSVEKGKITVVPGSASYKAECPLMIYDSCSLRLRVFSDIGQLAFDSGRRDDVPPGRNSLVWENASRAKSGLYIGLLEASSPGARKTQSKKIFFIVTRYR